MGRITRGGMASITGGFSGGLFRSGNGRLRFLGDALAGAGLDAIRESSLFFRFGLRSCARGGLIMRLSSLGSLDHAITLRRPFAYPVISSFIAIRIDLLVRLAWLLII
jgi:hypothetical protein